jgi:hypothetical protein
MDRQNREGAWRRIAQKTKGKIGLRGLGDCGRQWRSLLEVADYVIPAHKRVGLGRILSRQQIVGHRDHWKQDQDQQCEGDKLRFTIFARARRPPQPKAYDRQGHERARQVEDQFHSGRFYNTCVRRQNRRNQRLMENGLARKQHCSTVWLEDAPLGVLWRS